AHRAPAEDEGLRRDFAAGVRGHGRDAFLQARHGIRAPGTLLLVKEIETNDVKPASTQLFGHPEHPAVGHVAAGAVRADEERAVRNCEGGLEDRGSFLFSDLDPPFTRAHGGCVHASARYFIRSLILARAPRAHSSSNWPPGAPLTPSAPIAAPPAMMVTPPTAEVTVGRGVCGAVLGGFFGIRS